MKPSVFLHGTLIVMLAWLASAEEETVELKITTTKCRNSCKKKDYDKESCPSSIKVDEKELSSRKDGFNIIVLSSKDGKVVMYKHFRYFSGVAFWIKEAFKRFFESIKIDSIIIITFQNMCENLISSWYKSMSGIDHSVQYHSSPNQAIVIACKGKCPRTRSTQLPYTYYADTEMSFEKTITLVFPGKPKPQRTDLDYKRSGGYKADIISIIGGIVGAIVLTSLLYGVFLYCKQRNAPDEVYRLSPTENYNATTVQNGYNEKDCPIYETIAQPMVPTSPNGNMYVFRDEIKGRTMQVPETVARLPEPEVLYDSPRPPRPVSEGEGPALASAPPLSLYVSMKNLNENLLTTTVTQQPLESNNLL